MNIMLEVETKWNGQWTYRKDVERDLAEAVRKLGVYVVGKNKRYHVTGVRVHPRPVKAKSTAVKIKPTTAP